MEKELIELGFEKRKSGFWKDIGQDSFIYFDGKGFYLYGPDCPNESYAFKLPWNSINKLKKLLNNLT